MDVHPNTNEHKYVYKCTNTDAYEDKYTYMHTQTHMNTIYTYIKHTYIHRERGEGMGKRGGEEEGVEEGEGVR